MNAPLAQDFLTLQEIYLAIVGEHPERHERELAESRSA